MIFSFHFYMLLALCFVGMQFFTEKFRSFWFGLFNLFALTVLLGKYAAFCMLLLSSVLWVLLALYKKYQRDSNQQLARLFKILAYSLVVLLFTFHKSLLNNYGFLMVLQDSFKHIPFATNVSHLFAIMTFSYIFLRMIDMISAITSGARLLNPFALNGFLLPFFMLAAGPVNVYRDHLTMDQTSYTPLTFNFFLSGNELLLKGLFLKYVIANGIHLLWVGNGTWPTDTFPETVIAFIYIFFDFYGYSLIALGSGKLLGVPTPLNFQKPFLSRSLTEFWTRWHMSLGNFVRQNIFIPLQMSMVRHFGRKYAYLTNFIALILSFAFVGLWHRFSLRFLAWGLIMGGVMALEKVFRDRWGIRWQMEYTSLTIVQRIVGPLYVFALIVGGLMFVMPELIGNVK